MTEFAENLTKLMAERGVTARVISTATGIPTSTLSEWTGGREPKLSTAIIKLARFFGVSVEYLITGAEPEHGIVADMLSAAEDGFALIHRGIYRIRVDKYVGSNGDDGVKNSK